MLIRPARLLASKSTSSFLETVQQDSAGLTPIYYLDFANNRAAVNGADVGGISNVSGLTGTPNQLSNGHVIASISDLLTLTLSGVSYPLTVVSVTTRTTDTGASEDVYAITNGTANEYTKLIVQSTDQYRLQTANGAVQQANIAASGTSTFNVPVRIAGRVNTNTVQAARTINGGAVSLGTEDTSAVNPTGATTLYIGSNEGGLVSTFRGVFHKLIILSGAQNDTVLSILARP